MVTATNRANETVFDFPTDREIVMKRVFDAPRDLIFDVWTICEHLPHWLGPRAWKMTHCEIDLQPEGAWRYEWTGPEGEGIGMSGVYREIIRPELLVSTEVMDGFPGEALNRLALIEEAGRTTVTITTAYPSREVRDGVVESGMQSGVIESFERLDAYLRESQ